MAGLPGCRVMNPTVARWSMPRHHRKRWSARLVHRAQAPDQRCQRSGRGRRSGFLGTFSRDLINFAHDALCRWARRVRPARRWFSMPGSPFGRAHGAALVQPYASALINRDGNFRAHCFSRSLGWRPFPSRSTLPGGTGRHFGAARTGAAAVSRALNPEELLREDLGEPVLVALRCPATVDDEQSVQLGRHERVDDVGGVTLVEARSQCAGSR